MNQINSPSGCKVGSECNKASECFSGICTNSICTNYTTCAVTVGGWQTDKMCGGNCPACEPTSSCLASSDCSLNICLFPTASPTTMTYRDDKISGGRCPKESSCSDGEQNGVETDVDCGRVACCSLYNDFNLKTCPSLCSVGMQCKSSNDCGTNNCNAHEFEKKEDGSAMFFCKYRDLSASQPQYKSRVRGGVRLYGTKPKTIKLPLLLTALGAMLDIEMFFIQVEAVVGEVRLPEYGNVSYLNVRSKSAYNFTKADLFEATRVRWVAYIGDSESALMLGRMKQLFTARLMPGGWPSENVVQSRIDSLALDVEYCDWWGRKYTLASFNVSGIDCSLVLSCTTQTLPGNADTGQWSTRTADGSFLSSRYLYNTTSDTTNAQICTTTNPSVNHTMNAVVHHDRNPAYLPLVDFRNILSDNDLDRDLVAWIVTRCLPLWRASEAGPVAMASVIANDPLAAERCPQRLFRNDLRVVRPPTKVMINTTADAGILPMLPRFDFDAFLVAHGVEYNTTARAQALPEAPSYDTVFGQRSRPDPPSELRSPVSLQVVNELLGTPLSPLVVDQIAAQQPVVMLVDRHGRQVLRWKGDLIMQVAFDQILYEPNIFLIGTPLPSPSYVPIVNRYTEPDVVQKRLYPDNVFFELVQRPLMILGVRVQPLISDSSDLGFAIFTDLKFTRAVPAVAVNFTLTFTTALALRVDLLGATRSFKISEKPPSPLVIATRIQFPLAGVIIIAMIILGIFLYFFIFVLPRWREERETKRGDMVPTVPPKAVDAEGDHIVSGADSSVTYTPFPTVMRMYDLFFGVARHKDDALRPPAELRDEAFTIFRDFAPARYRMGALPGSMVAMMRNMRDAIFTRRHEFEANAKDISGAVVLNLRDTEKHALGEGDLRLVGPSAGVALALINDLLVPRPSSTLKNKQQKHDVDRVSITRAANDTSQAELDDLMGDLLGNVLRDVDPTVVVANEKIETVRLARKVEEALAEVRSTYSVRLFSERLVAASARTVAANVAAMVATGRTVAANVAATVVMAASARTIAASIPDGTPRPRPKKELVIPSVTTGRIAARKINASLLQLHARMTPLAPGLDPNTKLPKIQRSLNAGDEPPQDEYSQAKDAMLIWENAARERALAMTKNLHQNTAMTRTRSFATRSDAVNALTLRDNVTISTRHIPGQLPPFEVVEDDEHPIAVRRELPGTARKP